MLSALTPEQLARVATAGHERTFPPGQTIVRQGENGLALYLLLRGRVEVRRSGQRVAILVAGQFFGESALLVDSPRTADVFAATEVACFVLNRWDFWNAVGMDPAGDRAIYEQTIERLRSYQSKVTD